MACNRCCARTVKSTEITGSATELTITIPSVTVYNRQQLNIILAQSIPTTVTADAIVIIKSPDFKLTLIMPWGNFVYGDQILSRRVLRTRVATDTLAAMLTNPQCVRCTTHQYDTLPPAVVPPTEKIVVRESAR